MQTLRQVGANTFSWRPLKGVKNTIEVYSGADVFGTLRQKRGEPILAETAEGRWMIDKGKGTISVRTDDGAVVATFTSGKGGQGTLTLADGQVFRWAPTKSGTAERAFYDAAGARFVRFWKDWQLLKVEDRGEADPNMATRPEFPVLVILGRVIGIGTDDDVAVMAAISVATSG